MRLDRQQLPILYQLLGIRVIKSVLHLVHNFTENGRITCKANEILIHRDGKESASIELERVAGRIQKFDFPQFDRINKSNLFTILC